MLSPVPKIKFVRTGFCFWLRSPPWQKLCLLRNKSSSGPPINIVGLLSQTGGVFSSTFSARTRLFLVAPHKLHRVSSFCGGFSLHFAAGRARLVCFAAVKSPVAKEGACSSFASKCCFRACRRAMLSPPQRVCQYFFFQPPLCLVRSLCAPKIGFQRFNLFHQLYGRKIKSPSLGFLLFGPKFFSATRIVAKAFFEEFSLRRSLNSILSAC